MGRMRRGLVFSVWMVFVLLVGVFGVVLNVPLVKASGTIYIRTDGSVDPPDAPISTVDNVTYTLTGNILSDVDGIVVERSNIIIDGAGYTVEGAETGTGFSITVDNITVRNTYIQKFRWGIAGISECTIINNVITYNVKWGVYLGGSDNKIIGNRIANTGLNLVGYDIVGIYLGYDSNNNTIADNHIEKNGYVGSGILLDHSSGNTITGNNITNHDYAGIYLGTSSGNIIYHNNFINNYYQVYTYSANTWDDGYPSGGNYWSDYAEVDADGDGIGDTPYVIDADNQDRYPLMHPWSPLSVHNMNTGLGYATIQEAINADETLDGHTIFVETETYYENVVVNKTISLIGENKETTIIDGSGFGTVVNITSNGISLSGFTIRNSGDSDPNSGIYLTGSYATIRNNILTNNGIGTLLHLSSNNVIYGNLIINSRAGLALDDSCDNNLIQNNTVAQIIVDAVRIWASSNNRLLQNMITDNPGYAIYLSSSYNSTLIGNTIARNSYIVIQIHTSGNNSIYYNNFINNTGHISIYSSANDVWDDGYPSGGNYWSDYTGADSDKDGIGDSWYEIDSNNIDHLPLMGTFSNFKVTSEHHVQTICNSSISDFQFNGTAISFDVTGDDGTSGFCRICIPTALMNVTYMVFVNDTEVSYDLLPCSNETYSYLYFNYTHSTQEVIIIPEFPSFIIMLLFMVATIITAAIHKRKKQTKKP